MTAQRPDWFKEYAAAQEARIEALEERLARAEEDVTVAYRRGVHAMITAVSVAMDRVPEMQTNHLLEIHAAFDPQGLLRFHSDDPEGFKAFYGELHHDLIRKHGDLSHIVIPAEGLAPEAVHKLFSGLAAQLRSRKRPAMPTPAKASQEQEFVALHPGKNVLH